MHFSHRHTTALFFRVLYRPGHFTRTRRPEPETTRKYRFGSGSGSGSMLKYLLGLFYWTRGSRPRPVLVPEVPANNCIYQVHLGDWVYL